MGLATLVSGAGIIVSYDPGEPRTWRVALAAGGSMKYTETTATTVTEWPALTYTAAKTWADATKADGEDRKIDRVSNVGGGEYKAVSTIVVKTLTRVYEAPE